MSSNIEMLHPREPSPRPSDEGLLRQGLHTPPHAHAHGHGHVHEPGMASTQLTNVMDPNDLENPHNWPLHRKLFTSFACWCMAASVAHGLTAYTPALSQIIAAFDLNPTNSASYIPVKPIALFSLYLFGIAFAPIWTPHAAERLGRSKIYLVCLPICALFHLGAGLSQTYASLAVCRFFAGLAGGPSLVLLEGTFADIWDAETTNTYYAFQLLAQFFGTAAGPLIGGFLIEATNSWRWTENLSAILCAASVLLGLGISETYQREIPRRRAKRTGQMLHQDPALSGATLGEMVRVTVIDPILQFVSDPVTMMATLFLVFNFAVTLQWFITVPVALGSAPPAGPGYSISQVGLAFTTAIAGSALGALIIIFVEHVFALRIMRQKADWMSIEYRLLPAFLGVVLLTGSLFWIGFTVGQPTISPLVPICGTAVFVIGSFLNIGTMIPYLFDAFPPVGTLSALTAAASGRVLVAGALPLVILQFFTAVTPKWALFIFAFLSIPLWAVPVVLFKWGPTLRMKSRYSRVGGMVGGHGHVKVPSHDEETGYQGA